MITNANLILQHVIQFRNVITKHVNGNVKISKSVNKDYSWIPSTCTCENIKYLESIADTSGIMYDEIIFVMDNVSTKLIITIAKNVASTTAINCHSKK